MPRKMTAKVYHYILLQKAGCDASATCQPQVSAGALTFPPKPFESDQALTWSTFF